MAGLGEIVCFFFNDTATTEIYTLSLHDALPISGAARSRPRRRRSRRRGRRADPAGPTTGRRGGGPGKRQPWSDLRDRKRTRLNSSHANISYAVFCLKKK